MSFTAPWGLLAALALPAIVVLHLFRNRLPERRIAALFLFPQQALIAGGGRTRTRLLRTTSLWLELAAALALSLWLGGLSFGGRAATHLVLVLDDSASMAAAGVRARALQAAAEQLDGLGAGDLVTVLRTGPRPQLLAGPRALPADAARVLTSWQPALPRHDLAPALDLARELAHGGGEAVLLSDEPVPAGHEDITVIACGSGAANAAILTAVRLPGAAGERLRARIAAFGAMAGSGLSMFADERPLGRQPLSFRDGLADLDVAVPAGVQVLRLELDADALALDDRAWLLPPPTRVVAIADELPPETSQALAIDRVLAALPDVRSERGSAAAQLVLRPAPGTLAPGQLEVVIDRGAGAAVAWRGPFVVDRSAPELAGVALQGVVWVGTRSALPGRVLIAAGSQPLLTEEPLEQGRRWWLRLDAAAGNLSKAPDWPVLWANFAELARAEVPGVETTQVELGGEARYRAAAGGGPAQAGIALVAPDGSRVQGGGERTVGCVPAVPGVHTFVAADERPLGRCAVRFVDPAESDLRATRSERRAGVPLPQHGEDAVARDTGWERRLLALLVLVLVLADWWVLQRRAV